MSASRLLIDMNGDVGESFGAWTLGEDELLLDWISSANIACGYHAGDPATMKRTVRLCMEKGVSIGAHPGLPDLNGFGRREMRITPEEAYDLIVYQTGALLGFVRSEGGKLAHLKPHGALYHMAQRDRALAEAMADAVYRVDPELVLYGFAGSELIRAAEARGLTTASEAFADRTYERDGTLTPRNGSNGGHSESGVVDDPEIAADQVVRIVMQNKAITRQGEMIPLTAQTICIHGDSPHALAIAKHIHTRLAEEGIDVCRPNYSQHR